MKLHLIATLTIAIFVSFCGKSLVNAQAPTAELLTQNQEICENGNIPIEIKLSGTGPFNFKINIWNLTGETEVKLKVDVVEGFYPVGDANYIGNYTFNPNIASPRIDQIKIVLTDIKDQGSGIEIANGTGEAIITSYQTPTPNLAADASNCGLSIPISALPGPYGNTYEWTTLSGPSVGSFNSTNNDSTIFTGAVGEYRLNFKVINGPCVASEEINVTLLGSPTGEISTTSEICATGDAELKFALTGNGPWNLKYSNGTSQFPIIGISTTNSNWTHQLVNGLTTFNLVELTDVNECTAESGSLTGEATVVDLKPTAFAGLDDEICGDSFTMDADESTYSRTWIGPDGAVYSSINSATTDVTVKNYGPQNFIWELNNDGCTDQDTVTITFWEQPTANAGEDTTLYLKYQTNLKAELQSGFTGVWSLISGDGTIEDAASSTSAIKELKMGSTILEWTVTNGTCDPASYNFTIEVKVLKH
jgi:hypothetical protein